MKEEKELTEPLAFNSGINVPELTSLLSELSYAIGEKQNYDAPFSERLSDMREDFVKNIKKRKFKRAFSNLQNFLKLLSRIIIIKDYSSKKEWFDFFVDEQIHHIKTNITNI